MLRKKLYEMIINIEENGFATKLRRKRFLLFEDMVRKIDKKDKITVLDLGGTPSYWRQVYDIDKNPLNLGVTLLNINLAVCNESFFEYRRGDARFLHDMEENSFDIAFSNSMIEHVGDLTQQVMAVSEMKRVAKYLYLQTPNFFFPLEPHYQLFFVHWLPFSLKIKVLSRFYKKSNAYEIYLSDPINLLTKNDLRFLFDPKKFGIFPEKIFFLTKAFVVISKIINIHR
ncbi:MAG: methyltransferase domain-containing protein [Nitrospiraceae bacterium]|nr:methyltransferase domain-containing protein [Nitrospiraceae bacterium]